MGGRGVADQEHGVQLSARDHAGEQVQQPIGQVAGERVAHAGEDGRDEDDDRARQSG